MKKSKIVLLAVLIFSGCARVQPDLEPAAVCSAGSLTVMKMGFHTVASCDKNRGGAACHPSSRKPGSTGRNMTGLWRSATP